MTPPPTPLRLGWLSTGRGPGSRRLLSATYKAIQRGDLNARIEVLFCNRELGEVEGSDQFLALAQCYGIPAVTLSSRRFRREHSGDRSWRVLYDQEVVLLLSPYRTDLLVLAGFMLIMGDAAWQGRPAINLHPALPDGPQGTWQEVIWELIRQQARESGALVHLATAQVDQGPVVAYCRFPLRGGDFDALWREVEGIPVDRLRAEQGEENILFRRIREEGVKREVPLLLATLKAIANGRVHIAGNRVLDAEGRSLSGPDLTPEIEAQVRSSTSGP